MNYTEIIKTGEGKKMEFKEKLPSGEKLAKTIIAFANTAGGNLFIGISDKRDIIGVEEDDINDIGERIANIVHDSCSPFIAPEISTLNIKDKSIVMITVYPGSMKPYFLTKLGLDAGTYIRVGSTNKKADRTIINELIRQKSNISFDEEISFNYDNHNLNIEKLKVDFKAYSGKILDDKKMQNLKLFIRVCFKTQDSNICHV